MPFYYSEKRESRKEREETTTPIIFLDEPFTPRVDEPFLCTFLERNTGRSLCAQLPHQIH
jgi:hypothetical protein